MCHECSGPLGAKGGHQAKFAVGLSGQYSAHQLCPQCHAEAKERGGPGPNVSAKAYGYATAAHSAQEPPTCTTGVGSLLRARCSRTGYDVSGGVSYG